jgi:hypothetical protein
MMTWIKVMEMEKKSLDSQDIFWICIVEGVGGILYVRKKRGIK